MEINKILSIEFGITQPHTDNIISLIDEGCTIPFIARYRKEMTGSCDDQVLRAFDDRLKYLRNLSKRKSEVYSLIVEQGKMTDEISDALNRAQTMTEVEIMADKSLCSGTLKQNNDGTYNINYEHRDAITGELIPVTKENLTSEEVSKLLLTESMHMQ